MIKNILLLAINITKHNNKKQTNKQKNKKKQIKQSTAATTTGFPRYQSCDIELHNLQA